jgi:excisionase family DNA binding protein
MNQSVPEIMAIDDTAQYLRISQSSHYKLAQYGRIPCQKVSRHWCFRRAAIDHWLEQTDNINKASNLVGDAGSESGPGARAIEPDWVLNIRNQGQRTAIQFFFQAVGRSKQKKQGLNWTAACGTNFQHRYRGCRIFLTRQN